VSLRLGLCCQFLDSPIHFRTATHRYVSTLSRAGKRNYLATIAADNAAALAAAVERCAELGIGAFRINSQMLPLGTHPVSGYALEALDKAGEIRGAFARARELAGARGIRLSFHPDQFVVINSERADVVRSSIEELEYQAGMAEMVGADTVVFHGGSTAGGLPTASERLQRGLDQLSDRARKVIALENDDHRFAPADLLPAAEDWVCRWSTTPTTTAVTRTGSRWRRPPMSPRPRGAGGSRTPTSPRPAKGGRRAIPVPTPTSSMSRTSLVRGSGAG
jgi:UV DNA damage endonuclease